MLSDWVINIKDDYSQEIEFQKLNQLQVTE